jgi:hypothetical protein
MIQPSSMKAAGGMQLVTGDWRLGGDSWWLPSLTF